MLRLQVISLASLIFLLFSPALLHAQARSFISFDVQPGISGTVILKWKNIRETDTLNFQVERSRDEKNWEAIVRVNVGLSDEYSTMDNPQEGLNYYRVTLIDNSGSLQSTAVKWVQVNKARNLYIWPNPTRDVLHVKTPYTKGIIDLLDSDGKLISKVPINDFITDIALSRLSKGIYFLQIKYDNQLVMERILKQ